VAVATIWAAGLSGDVCPAPEAASALDAATVYEYTVPSLARPSSGHEVVDTFVQTVFVPLPVRVTVYVVGPGPFASTAVQDTETARLDASVESTEVNEGAPGVGGAPADWPVTFADGPGPWAFTATTVNVYCVSLLRPVAVTAGPVTL
jgi:hypothetical protein